eukprot:m.202311 g.202311  ORF g.202311 m.202311 type:complete len:278 (-) comp18824_c0_seq5:297-1130(-)
MFTLRRLRRCQGFLMQSLRSFSGYADGRGNYTIIPGVLQLGDERLRVLSQTVELPAMLDSSSPERKGAALAHAKLQEFRQTMGYGRGIAAPQVNCPIRMIAVDLGGPNEKYEPLSLPMLGFYPAAAKTPFSIVNPVFTHRSNATMSMWDDCMSFPHLMVRLRRHCSVSLEFYTVVQLQDMGSGYGAPKTTPDTSNAMRAHGTLVAANDTEGIVHVVWHNLPPEVSELLQHEVDHLDGVLAVDHVQPGADEDIVDRNTWLKHQDQYNGTVDYVIVPTV